MLEQSRFAADWGMSMQLGMVGLGRMGGNMVQRLLKGGHRCVVFDSSAANVASSVDKGAEGARSIAELVTRLTPPRIVWMMVPAPAVDSVLGEVSPHLHAGDIVVDGGNTHYVDDIRRAEELQPRGIQYVDAGVSGGIWGLERGYCLMVGGERAIFSHLEPIFTTLAPPAGHLHCGPAGAGHFVKMVHNAIEYGLMAAYAEGFNLLAHADHFQYDFDIPAIAEVWRHGSVIESWLLDLTARALAADPELRGFAGHVSDSGEGRWAAHAAIDSVTPAAVLTAALFHRFSSRGEGNFADRLLSAMRQQFGGHQESPAGGKPNG
jgi:6-phosphogluconate dehydrogenase